MITYEDFRAREDGIDPARRPGRARRGRETEEEERDHRLMLIALNCILACSAGLPYRFYLGGEKVTE